MRQRVFYVSADPAHAGGWIVSAPAMRALGFPSREAAMRWAIQQASAEQARISSRVLLQEEGNQWDCIFANEFTGHEATGFAGARP